MDEMDEDKEDAGIKTIQCEYTDPAKLIPDKLMGSNGKFSPLAKPTCVDNDNLLM